jgi:hypothetical protein
VEALATRVPWLLTVLTHVPALFVNILELAQGLDNVDIFSGPGNDEFRSFVKTVIQNFQRLKNVTPVLAFIVQSFVEHVHYLVKIARAVDAMGQSDPDMNLGFASI